MGVKDITEKRLAEYNDVFADIVNVLLFNGERRIKPEQLHMAETQSMFRVEGELHEQERDVSKYWEPANVRIALYGLENQTDIDKDMPLRVYGYDGAAYKGQTLSGRKERYPVITLVLYFGTRRWTKPLRLTDCFDVPEYLKPYVNDSKINLFEIAYLTEEQVSMFQSDFRIVADYFVQVRKNHDYEPSRDVIVHVEEMLKLMSTLAGDDSFVRAYNKSEGGGTTMCEVMEKTRAEGRMEGIVLTMTELGYSVEEIAQKKGIPEDKILEIIEQNEQNQ